MASRGCSTVWPTSVTMFSELIGKYWMLAGFNREICFPFRVICLIGCGNAFPESQKLFAFANGAASPPSSSPRGGRYTPRTQLCSRFFHQADTAVVWLFDLEWGEPPGWGPAAMARRARVEKCAPCHCTSCHLQRTVGDAPWGETRVNRQVESRDD